MNIRKIIREELNTLSDSFYLIVSDDENFIYGTSKLGGKSFQPVGDFNAEAILRSRYNSENEALDQISWNKHYENDSKIGGSLTTAGKIANNFLKYNPKIVPVDFILNKRDQNFPMMESEMDDFGWVKEVNPFQPGKFFDEDDICFESNNTCKVNINKDDITFVINWDDWVNWTELDDDSTWYVEPLLYHGTDYAGGGDYYEFDSDEFNYSGYHITNPQKERFQKILDFTTKGKEKIGDFINNDNMWGLEEALRYPRLIDLLENLSSDYLNELGYTVQKNRWLSLGVVMEDSIKKSGADWDLYGGNLKISVPMEVVWKWYGSGVENLSDLLIKVSEPITDQAWYDWFYEEWDTSGAEVEEYFDQFLDKAEEFLEESDEIEEMGKKLNVLDSLNMKKINSGWSMLGNQYKRVNSNDTIWYIKVDNDFEKAELELYHKNDNRYSTKPKRVFKIPFEKLPQYINQYSLKLESTK
jgi:hypothetical protein